MRKAISLDGKGHLVITTLKEGGHYQGQPCSGRRGDSGGSVGDWRVPGAEGVAEEAAEQAAEGQQVAATGRRVDRLTLARGGHGRLRPRAEGRGRGTGAATGPTGRSRGRDGAPHAFEHT
jgi:hypothetical protein